MDDVIISFGGEVKALGGGRIAGQLVQFSDADNPDLSPQKDYFDAATDLDFEDGQKVSVYFHHGLDDTLGARKLGRVELKSNALGVFVDGVLNMRDEYERALYELAAKNKLSWSSGAPSHLVRREKVEGKDAHHVLHWPIAEASLTPCPADYRNQAVALKSVSFKSLLAEIVAAEDGAGDSDDTAAVKAVSGAADLPLADKDTAWDASAADKRVRDWAGAGDEPNAKYAKAFMVKDGDGSKFGDFKLPFADVVGGELKAIPRALNAIASVLGGGRGGVDISDADRKAVEARLDAYRDKMGGDGPDGDGDEDDRKSGKSADPDAILDALESLPFKSFLEVVGAAASLTDRRLAWYAEQRAVKQGRVISQSNLDAMRAVHDGLKKHVADLGDIIARHTPEQRPKATTAQAAFMDYLYAASHGGSISL